MRRTPLARVVVVLALGAAAAGCGGGSGGPRPPGYGSEDGKLIADVIDAFNEVKYDPARAKKLFASGQAPSTRQYDPYRYDVDGNPSVSGATATARIKVIGDADSKEKGTAEWTFSKEGSGWKIKTAPLP